jgi:3-oxoacyl-[acyl-carrier protein] reductase
VKNAGPTPERERVALVTGAAGGFGRALVEALGDAGWRVFAGTHRNPGTPWPPGIEAIALDVTDGNRAREVAAHVEQQAGRIDLLVNNAGVAVDEILPRLADDDWEHAIATNLDGAFRTTRAFLPLFVRQRDGHIVNVSSHAAHGTAGQSAYAAAKAGLIGMTQSLARELGSRNIRVNAVLPGVLPTGMTSGLTAERLAAFAAANALGRLNDPAEVARFVVHLATMRNVSGQVFHLDSRPTRWT